MDYDEEDLFSSSPNTASAEPLAEEEIPPLELPLVYEVTLEQLMAMTD